ncbi:MAG TPA: PQQ-binding-like beta-propeller repeat protein [Vicinamibacteria bacterium]|jgi:outer membrane protein assembly factor BamB
MTSPRRSEEDRSASIDLSVPLEEVWSYRQPHVPALPVVEEGLVFFGDSQRHTTAIAEESRKKLWQSEGTLAPLGWWSGFLLGYAPDNQHLRLIEAQSGRTSRETGVPGGCVYCGADARWVAGAGYGEQWTIWCLDPGEAKLLWSTVLEKGVHVAGVGPLLAGDTVVIALDNGEVRAWHAETGKPRWASTLADLSWRRMSGQVEPGTARGRASVRGNRIFFNVTDHHVAALDLEDGSRSWTWGGPPFVIRDGQVRGDNYYALGWAGEYRILDAANGLERFAINLQRQLPRGAPVTLAPPLLVTESHILAGSEQGNVTAFGRDNGKFTWTYRPKATGSTIAGDNQFVVGNHRIYYGDATFRIRCLAPGGTKPAKAARRKR